MHRNSYIFLHLIIALIVTVVLLPGHISAQTNQQIKQQIETSGLSEQELRELARQRGMTDKQIDAEIEQRGLEQAPTPEPASDEPQPEQVETQVELEDQSVDLPPLDELVEEQLGEEETVVDEVEVDEAAVIVDEQLPGLEEIDYIIDFEDLPIVVDEFEQLEGAQLAIESKAQPGRQAVGYFGYDIFQRDPAIFQSSLYGAIDPDYLIGPGDEIIIMLWGETQFRRTYTIDREGYIFIPEEGQVFVNGLTLELLEQKLLNSLSRSYSTLKPLSGNPTTYLDVTLGKIRPLRVLVLGEVAQPGAYTMSPTTSLFTSLYYFRGPTNRGSLRDIRLVRNNEVIASIDFYEYLLTGKMINDFRLQLDDIIYIPPRGKTVTISGEINRPAIFELKGKEGLRVLIRNIAGGLRTTAYMDRAQIDRIVPFAERDALGMDRKFVDVNLKNVFDTGYPLEDGDRIQVFSVLDMRKNSVTVNGAVTRPGIYDIGDGLKLSELIYKADGLLGDAYMERVDIIRITEDLKEQLIRVNLVEVILKPDKDFALRGMDRVRVFSKGEMIPRQYVAITGHVRRPGRYLLLEDIKLHDLIFRSGGFVDKEWLKRTYLPRAELVRVTEDRVTKEIIPFNLAEVLEKRGLWDIRLRPYDVIRIFSLSEIKGERRFVSVSGHVKRPGRYELFEENMTIYDLLFKAGGFEDEEYRERTYLPRAELVRVTEDRATKEIIPFDLAEVLEKRGLWDIRLRPYDVIRIFSLSEIKGERRFVSVSGHVKRPGRYELFEENMTIYDLLFKAGGFEDEEYRERTYLDRADLIRELDDGINRTVVPFNIGEVLNNLNSEHNLQLVAGDAIRVYAISVFEYTSPVRIDGVVKNPGRYQYKFDMTVKDLILEAGGFSEDVYKYKIEIARVDPDKVNDNTYAEIITVDLLADLKITDIRSNQSKYRPFTSAEFQLKSYDYVSVRPDPYFSLQRTVTVGGSVYYPGVYSITNPNEKVTDIIYRAGGLRPEAYARASTLIRGGQTINLSFKEIIKNPRSKLNFAVIDGDQINVAVHPNLVIVQGEVNAPGLYRFIEGNNLSDYIDLAGDYSQNAEKSNVWIRYPDGFSKRLKFLSNPAVYDGSVITVGREPEEEPFDKTEFAKEVASILASLATAISVVILAGR